MDIFYPIQVFADWLTYSVFSIPKGSLLASAVNFFIYDVIKIFILLSIIIFIVSFIRTYLPPEKVRKILSRQNEYVGNVLASFLGVITLFCSCSRSNLSPFVGSPQ